MNSLRARLIKDIPEERFIEEPLTGRKPRIGDIVELDQGYTDEEGQSMVIAYCSSVNGKDYYQAEVYETELEFVEL